MSAMGISRRALALRLAAIPLGVGAAAGAMAAEGGDGLSHSAEAIHQEILFKASRARVFAALTSSQQFDAVTRLSDALALVTASGAKATSISRDLGAPFTLFGGYVTGRNLDLVPDERLVQAWRAGSWKPGEFSIARFDLLEDGAGTKLLFQHRGFPAGEGIPLSEGWHTHYWTPLAKYLTPG